MSEHKTEDWKDIAIHFAVGTMREMGNNIARSFQEKMDRAVAIAMRKIFSGVLLFIGIVFLLVGVAQILGEVLGGSPAFGYVLVGAFSVVVAMAMSIVKGEKM